MYNILIVDDELLVRTNINYCSKTPLRILLSVGKQVMVYLHWIKSHSLNHTSFFPICECQIWTGWSYARK